MEEHVNAAVKLELPEGELLLDSLYIKSGACGIIPFALPCGSGFLEKQMFFCCAVWAAVLSSIRMESRFISGEDRKGKW